MDIRIRNLRKNFGSFQALDGVDLDIRSGELIALLGPSGSGKTTLLRAIAGLDHADSGDIFFGHEDALRLSVRERRVGFMFQHYALFRHMRVFDNVAFGLRMLPRRTRPSETLIRQTVLDLIDLVQLKGLQDRFPTQLSGGQRQRVALARALAINPRVLLLDEPFGALDAKVRKDLRRWLRALHEKTGYTTVFVTHDQEEALELADRVVVMNKGRIEQIGATDEVYEQPESAFVFEFLGSTNVLPVDVRSGQIYLRGQEQLIATDGDAEEGAQDLYVRAGDLRLAEPGQPGFEVQINTVQRTGPFVRLGAEVLATRQPIELELPHLHHSVRAWTEQPAIRVKPNLYSLFPRRGARSTQRLPDVPPHASSEHYQRESA